MKKRLSALLAPDVWVRGSTVLACFGFVLVFVGNFLHNKDIANIGKWLLAPVLIGGILTVTVVIPLLIWENQKIKGTKSKPYEEHQKLQHDVAPLEDTEGE